jgi:single-strand DNA-binding protein
MIDVNNCTFTGRLTRDGLLKTTPTGTNVLEFDIANNTGFGNYAKTLFLSVNLWGKQAESLSKYLQKGKTVAVIGTLEQQKWTGKDGMPHEKNVINARDVVLLGGGSKSADMSDEELDRTVF